MMNKCTVTALVMAALPSALAEGVEAVEPVVQAEEAPKPVDARLVAAHKFMCLCNDMWFLLSGVADRADADAAAPRFRELLDALATSIGSGKNVVDSFKAARDDLRVIYSEETAIIKELDVILDGITNNVDVEKSLLDFGIRSGLDDIISFANVFETCYRKGGNIKDVIKNTQQIITEKMEVEMEIQTIVAGAKNEQMIMTVMPIALIAIIKMMSPEFAANFATPSGIISTTIAVVMFIVAYFVGNIVLAIKI